MADSPGQSTPTVLGLHLSQCMNPNCELISILGRRETGISAQHFRTVA